jgi:hypothetical protein
MKAYVLARTDPLYGTALGFPTEHTYAVPSGQAFWGRLHSARMSIKQVSSTRFTMRRLFALCATNWRTSQSTKWMAR